MNRYKNILIFIGMLTFLKTDILASIHLVLLSGFGLKLGKSII